MNNSASSSAAPESHVTSSSSKLTSSDKLSALPSPTSPNPNTSRTARSPTFSALTNVKRGYRHSLDGSTSLPSFSLADHESPALSNSVWMSNQSMNARFDAGSATYQRRNTPENASTGKETPRQRVSFDSDRNSLPTMQSVGQAFSRLTRGSDPGGHSPALRSSAYMERREGDSTSNVQNLNSRSPSRSRSRAASPLRMLQQWSAGLHRGHRAPVEEPFVPIDPFKFRAHFPLCCLPTRSPDLEIGEGSASSGPYDCEDILPVTSLRSFFNNAHIFVADTLPRQIYLNFLLRLPAMYFSRVARIFEDAEVSRPDIQRMIDASGGRGGPRQILTMPAAGASETNILAHSTPAHIPLSTIPPPAVNLSPGATSGIGLSAAVSAAPVASMMHMPLPFPDEWTTPLVSPALIRFKHSWEAFIDSLLREWKTLNVVSALLSSAILTIFQIPEAADDPVTRTAALLSLICALMSLSYGCMYIVRFGTMRNMFHASRWAEEARKDDTSIWWNVWVMLAMPAVWMAWSMLLFVTAILSFVWRTGSVLDPADRPPLGARASLGPRIAITCVFALGVVYLAMIVRTLKKYGSYEGSTQALLRVGMTARNSFGGGTQGNTTDGNGDKKIRARDIDAAMERRGRERERSTSTNIRRREEDMERREQTARGTGERDVKKGELQGRMVGLGYGSRISTRDADQGMEVEMDTRIDGGPTLSTTK
ncbi:hypothetical protein B0H34DRAFT_208824 [Crassisporium funariophilum]|nr:hypothetical protein B0H34DRAFT_208824 [Crassisporium funariophilum]